MSKEDWCMGVKFTAIYENKCRTFEEVKQLKELLVEEWEKCRRSLPLSEEERRFFICHDGVAGI